MAFVDFKVIKETVSIQEVLGHYNLSLRSVGGGASLRGRCPLPTHTSKKNFGSFGADTGKNIWACQSASCVAGRQGKKGGNVLDLVALMENCSIHDAAVKLSTWFSIGGSSPETSKNGNAKKPEPLVAEKTSVTPEETNPPLSFALKDVTPLHPYLQGRGVEEKVAQEFGIGFFPGRGSMAGRVVIPIHDREGRLVAYAGRSIDDTEPKYKLPTGFKKSLELYNLHRVLGHVERGEQVILVEGFFDCIRVISAGFPNVVALTGCTLSEAQEEILTTEFREAVLFLDGNDAGRKGSEEIALRLSKKMFVRIIETPTDKEPDTLSPEEIKTLLGSL